MFCIFYMYSDQISEILVSGSHYLEISLVGLFSLYMFVILIFFCSNAGDDVLYARRRIIY